ncbi:MAG: 7TM diverse intracellular signaling domain-containing protein, partial [Spirochaetota bacterium]
KGRTARVPDLPIENLPRHRFLSVTEFPAESFTYLIPFGISSDEVTSQSVLGLQIAGIGINWEVFINGHSIRRDIFMEKEKITRSRFMQNVLIPVDKRILHSGTNILAIRIIGDPALKYSGIYRPGPFRIGNIEDLRAEQPRTLQLILMTLYLIVGLYSIFLYYTRSESRYYLFYGLFSIAVCAYILSRFPAAITLVADSSILGKIELVCLFLTIPLIGFMLDYFLFLCATRLSKAYALFCGILSAAVIATPPCATADILTIWQSTAAFPILFYSYRLFRHGFLRDYTRLLSAAETARCRIVNLKIIGKTLIGSFSGNILLGAAAIALCSIFDIIDA